MINRRAFVTGLGAMLAAPRAVEAEQTRIYRVGVLTPRAVRNAFDDLLEKRMRELGWVNGVNVKFIYRHGKVNDALPSLAQELVRERVDIILTAGTPASLAAKNATATIPVVFYSVGDPVGVGLVANLGQPGANVTGISGITYQLGAKRLELLMQTLSDVRAVAILLNPTDPTVARVFATLKAGAKATKVTLEPFYAGRPIELNGVFQAMKRRHVNGLLVQPDGLFWAQRTTIVKLAADARLPTIYAFREDAEAGGLIAYGASATGMLKQAIVFMDKILRSAKPSSLPVQEPTELELVINLKTATALGLTIPPSLLLRADQVIE